MNRLDDWEIRLLTYIRSIKKKPFRWGEHDCFIFAGSAIYAQTGEDIYSGAVGKYYDSETAKQFCKENGFKSHIHYISKHLSPRPSILHAMRGDIVAMRSVDGNPALGVCQGDGVYGIGDEGIYTAPLSNARKVFAI